MLSQGSDQPGHWLSAHWVTKDPGFLPADSKDSNETELMTRLIRPRGYKTFLMLNSTEHKVSSAYKN